MIYGLRIKDLVDSELGFSGRQRQANWLDIDPPDKLIEAVAARTGVSTERIQRMTIASLRPVLSAYFDPKFYSLSSILAARPMPRQPSLHKWVLRPGRARAWTACRSCLQTYPNASILLPWRLRIVTSCPAHGMMLEPLHITEEDFVNWPHDSAEEAPESVRSLDARTWQALTTGSVSLPGGSVHASLWFCLLRTIWDELNRPVSMLGECHEQAILAVRVAVDRFLQRAANSWKSRAEETKHAILVATAMEMMQKGIIFPEGPEAKYFCTGALRPMSVL